MPAFRSSYTIAATTFYELRKATGTGKLMILVPLVDLKSLGPFRRLRCRDFKSAALEGASRGRQGRSRPLPHDCTPRAADAAGRLSVIVGTVLDSSLGLPQQRPGRLYRPHVERAAGIARQSGIEVSKSLCEEKVTQHCLFRSWAVHASRVHHDGAIGAVQLWRRPCACLSLRTIRISIVNSAPR